MKKLWLAKDLGLPLDLMMQTIAVLGQKGSGKTFTGMVIAEELLEAGQQVVTIDPTGAHWGLKSSADGKRAGFPITIFGGDHADLPLREDAGKLLARALVEKRFSAILDLSLFRKGPARRLVTDFLEELYVLNREPMHLVVDEADDIAPQKPQANEAQMLGAIEDIVKRGRKKGIGCTLVTQRPADLAKQVLTQCSVLVAMRLVHPRDISPVMEWVRVHADPQQAQEMVASLPSLKTGSGWVWSPGWGNIFQRTTFRERGTFDSSATPKPGVAVVVPKHLAKIDVEKLGAEIAALASEAAENDPKALRARIKTLEADLAKSQAVVPAVAEKVTATHPAVVAAVQTAVAARDKHWERVFAGLKGKADKAVELLIYVADSPLDVPPEPKIVVKAAPAVVPAAAPATVAAKPVGNIENLSKCESAILLALYWVKDDNDVTPAKVGFYSGYSHKAGGFNNSLSRLRNHFGYVAGWSLTPAGLALAAQCTQPKPTGLQLREWLRPRLSKVENEILDVLIAAGGERLSATEIARRTASGYSAAAGGFNNGMAKLRSIEAADGYERDGGTRADLTFFEA